MASMVGLIVRIASLFCCISVFFWQGTPGPSALHMDTALHLLRIVDEFTGRVMEGRRWSNGLHQAGQPS